MQYWQAYVDSVHTAVQRLYDMHRAARPGEADRLLTAFLELPTEAPVQPHAFGVSWSDVMQEQRMRLQEALLAEGGSRCSIADALNTALPIERLCPFFLTVYCRFVGHTGISLSLIHI